MGYHQISRNDAAAVLKEIHANIIANTDFELKTEAACLLAEMSALYQVSTFVVYFMHATVNKLYRDENTSNNVWLLILFINKPYHLEDVAESSPPPLVCNKTDIS